MHTQQFIYLIFPIYNRFQCCITQMRWKLWRACETEMNQDVKKSEISAMTSEGKFI